MPQSIPGADAAAPPDPEATLAAFVADAEAANGFRLYPAQEEALLEIAAGSNAIVATPTGTGKSLIAQGAHALNPAVNPGTRTFYTAPIKALVSEKFFALGAAFGATNVGLVTGDSAVNAEAPIVCCTAEILANLALREGAAARIGAVVMDEFHYYGDPDRGWAWQVPLIELPRAQFVLMSATLGDTSAIADDLTRRTGRATASITGVERPVPLHFAYARTPVHETIRELIDTRRAPVYVVHFSQADAVERAQALASVKLIDRARRDEIAAAIGEFRFRAGFGPTLSRLVRAGIGVHHAGMLPRYRRLVEQLAQQGLLTVICGTDTLGVGINVPIRSVLITALSKYDGRRVRRLGAREFHQIAGRAGRAGYDVAGDVLAQAPDWEIENLIAEQKAGDDPKKRRKIQRKSAPAGFVSWSEATFVKLQESAPEPLRSQMRITNAMILSVAARGGDVVADVRRLVFDNHESRVNQFALARRAIALYRSLRDAGILVHDTDDAGRTRVRLTVDVPPHLALNQPLSPFAIATVELLEPESPEYPLDVLSIIESTLDDPKVILAAQQNAARRDAIAAMKADGLDYEQRMALIDDVSYPKPLAELIDAAYHEYVAHVPWAADFEPRPKSVVRELYERAFDFRGFVGHYGLARSEGTVLRYLSDAYRTLVQTVPVEAHGALHDVAAWLGALVRGVDSSLLDEWAALAAGADGDQAAAGSGGPAAVRSIVDDRRAFTVLVRNALFRRVQLAAFRRVEALGELDREAGWPAERWAQALDGYFAEYEELGIGPDARNPALLRVRVEEGRWVLRQSFADPAGDHDWGISAEVDLTASAEAGEPIIRVTDVGPHR